MHNNIYVITMDSGDKIEVESSKCLIEVWKDYISYEMHDRIYKIGNKAIDLRKIESIGAERKHTALKTPPPPPPPPQWTTRREGKLHKVN